MYPYVLLRLQGQHRVQVKQNILVDRDRAKGHGHVKLFACTVQSNLKAIYWLKLVTLLATGHQNQLLKACATTYFFRPSNRSLHNSLVAIPSVRSKDAISKAIKQNRRANCFLLCFIACQGSSCKARSATSCFTLGRKTLVFNSCLCYWSRNS